MPIIYFDVVLIEISPGTLLAQSNGEPKAPSYSPNGFLDKGDDSDLLDVDGASPIDICSLKRGLIALCASSLGLLAGLRIRMIDMHDDLALEEHVRVFFDDSQGLLACKSGP